MTHFTPTTAYPEDYDPDSVEKTNDFFKNITATLNEMFKNDTNNRNHYRNILDSFSNNALPKGDKKSS